MAEKVNDEGLREKRAEPGFLITPALLSIVVIIGARGSSAPGIGGREVAALRRFR